MASSVPISTIAVTVAATTLTSSSIEALRFSCTFSTKDPAGLMRIQLAKESKARFAAKKKALAQQNANTMAAIANTGARGDDDIMGANAPLPPTRCNALTARAQAAVTVTTANLFRAHRRGGGQDANSAGRRVPPA